jgi:hypothetical protein
MNDQTDREELKDLLGKLKGAERRYLLDYVRGSTGLRASLRQSLQGDSRWLKLLEDLEADQSDRQVVAEVLEELETTSPTNLREVRILAERGGRLLRLCKFSFTKRDFSLYVVPYAPNGRYFFGSDSMAEHEVERTLDFTAQLTSEETPHVSIHDRGQVHVRTPQVLAGPLQAAPLASLSGQHVLSISADSFDGLSSYEGAPKTRGSEIDLVIPVDPELQSGRLAVYVNGEKPTFDHPGSAPPMFTLTRQGRDLYVAVVPIGQKPLGQEDRRGITVIAGWDPRARVEDQVHFLFVRGE